MNNGFKPGSVASRLNKARIAQSVNRFRRAWWALKWWWERYWIWMLVILTVASMAVIMFGCKSGSGWFGIFGNPSTKPQPNGHSPDVSTLNFMALVCFIPGVICLVAAAVSKGILPTARIGWTLLCIGFAAAILATLIKAYATWIILSALGCSLLVFALWLWGHRKRIMQGDVT